MHDIAKLIRLMRDLENGHATGSGLSRLMRDATLQIQDIRANPRPADPTKDAIRIEVLQRDVADLAARLAVNTREVQALDQLVKACQRYVDDEVAAETAATLAANVAATTEDQQ